MITKQQNLVCRGSNSLIGTLEQAEPQILRRVFNSIKITGKSAFGCRDDQSTGMSELVAVSNIAITKSHGLRNAINRILATRQEMKTGLAAGAPINSRVVFLLFLSQIRSLPRIETDRDELVVFSEFQGNGLAGFQKSVQNTCVQSIAAQRYLNQCDHDEIRLLRSRKYSSRSRTSLFVAEHHVERELTVQVLLDPHVANQFRGRTFSCRRLIRTGRCKPLCATPDSGVPAETREARRLR